MIRLSLKQKEKSSHLPLSKNHIEYDNSSFKITSLYRIVQGVKNANLFIFDTESEKEEIKELEIPAKLREATCITELSNGDLFCICKTIPVSFHAFIIDKNYGFRQLPSRVSGEFQTAICFKDNVHCFGGKSRGYFFIKSNYFDLDKNRWIELSQMPMPDETRDSVVFNENILISGLQSQNLLIYSTEVDSFSTIPYNFADNKRKPLVKAEERLYLIECGKNARIYESEACNEYIWHQISNSIIDYSWGNSYSYNEGKCYISTITNWGATRNYYKFDLDIKELIEIASYDKHIAVKKVGKNIEVIEGYGLNFNFSSDDLDCFHKGGYTLGYLGNKLENLVRCDEKIDLNPRDAGAYYSKGKILHSLSRHLQAIEFYNKAIEIDSTNYDYYNHKSYTLAELGRNLEVVECIEKMLEFRGDDSYCYYRKGNALAGIGRMINAIECYNKAIECGMSDSKTYRSKGKALFDLGRYEEAIKCYDEALNLNPYDSSLHEYKIKALNELK